MKRRLSPGLTLRLWLYRLVFPLVLIFLLPGMIRRMVKRGNFRRNLGQRFGFFSPQLQTRLQNAAPVWLQSISVGETNVALRIARELLSRDPALSMVISVTTSTGYDIASRSVSERLYVIYNPIDLAGIVRRTLHALRPRALVLVEATWPVLVAETTKMGVPVSLVARLSPRSARGFLRFRWLAGPIFSLLDHVFVQEPEEVDLWQKLGARSSNIHCTGAIKYDEPSSPVAPREDFRAFLQTLGVKKARPILLAGSTFAGEERILAETFLALRPQFPDLFLILVPRHVERTSQILAELHSLDLRIARRTQPASGEPVDGLLVDTTGELRDWYALANVVFIGKSLTSTGGQNPVEAALLGKPVVFGPHMENFGPIVHQWLQTDAALQVASASELPGCIGELLANPAEREARARRALEAVAIHFGATARVVDFLIPNRS